MEKTDRQTDGDDDDIDDKTDSDYTIIADDDKTNKETDMLMTMMKLARSIQ